MCVFKHTTQVAGLSDALRVSYKVSENARWQKKRKFDVDLLAIWIWQGESPRTTIYQWPERGSKDVPQQLRTTTMFLPTVIV